MNIVVPDHIDFTEDQLTQLKSLKVTLYNDLPKTEAEIYRRIKVANIITANYIDITQSIIDSATNLKYIVVPAVGYEWVDTVYARSKGITVVNCPTYNSQSVAEMALTLILTSSRKVLNANSELKNGNWNPQPFTGNEVSGKTIGLIGHGNIGNLIDKIAASIGMTTSYVNSKSSTTEIDSLIMNSDYVVLCVQLNNQTTEMITARRISLMKRSSYLVNVSRGAVIDQSALLSALKNKKIRGAALDVFDGEPLIGTPSSEIIEITNLDNVVATPHIGANTEESHAKLGAEVIANILAILAGSPQHIVNR